MNNVNSKIQDLIDKKVVEEQRESEREMSGRLSAGKLGFPVQWQLLNYFKVLPAKFDAFTLKKFQRGKDVENRIIDWIEPQEKQKEVEYRGVVGFVDAILDGVPLEIKSTTNLAFKYIQKGGIKRGHKLQAEFYALALGLK